MTAADTEGLEVARAVTTAAAANDFALVNEIIDGLTRRQTQHALIAMAAFTAGLLGAWSDAMHLDHAAVWRGLCAELEQRTP